MYRGVETLSLPHLWHGIAEGFYKLIRAAKLAEPIFLNPMRVRANGDRNTALLNSKPFFLVGQEIVIVVVIP